MTRKLRAVEPGETAPRRISTVLAAAEAGSRLDEMIQMRRVIARAIDNENTSPRDLAALTRRQIEISKEIEAVQRQQEEEAEEGAISADEAWSEEAI